MTARVRYTPTTERDAIALLDSLRAEAESRALQGQEPDATIGIVDILSLRLLFVSGLRERLIDEVDRLDRWQMAWGGGSNSEGICRHGMYIGGSGADLMCGACEQQGITDDLQDLRDMLAVTQ